METDEQGLLADENEEETSCKKQKITQIVVDKVKFTIPLEHTNHKAQTTSVATERSKETDSKMALFGNEWQNMGTFLGSEEFKGFSSNMHKFQGKETSCIMSNVHGIESFGECNTSISSGKGKISLIGIRRQKTGRYGAVIRDTIRRKQVWLGTFDTVEEASQAYFNKKLELENEKLNQQGNKEDRPEENCDQIQQPESPVVQCLSMANDQTSDTACVNRINSHETTRIVEVHKNKMSGEEPGSSKETTCGMASVRGTESSVECNTSTSCNSKGEISLIGVRRQKNGRYGAVIRDTIRRKQVWLGTFDTVEEASLAYFSKKLELENENLNQQGNKESKSKENIDQIQQPESPSVQCLSVGNDQIQPPESPSNDQIQPPESSSVQCLSVANNQTLDTASVSRINSHITTTHILGVHKKNWSGKEQEFSKVTSCLMANVQGTESSNECNTTTSCLPTEKRSLLGIRRQKNGRYGAVITDKRSLLGIRRQKTGKYGAVITDKIRHKQIWLGTFDTVEEASQAYFSKKFEFEKLSQQDNKDNKPKENLDQIQQPESPVMQCLSMAIDPTLDTAGVNRINPHETTHIVEVHKNNMSGKEPGSSKETPCLMASVHGTESSAECNTSTSCNPTGKISLVGVRRQKNGRYGAVVRDKIRRKQVWLGTFDTVEEASQAYFSKKSELEKKKLNQQRNKDNRSKKNGDRIQQPGSPVVLASLSVTDVQAFDTASVGMRNERIDFHKTTHIVGVHKSKTAGKEPESSKETSCLMDNVHDTESYDEGNTTTSRDPTAKRSLRGIRRQKSGRYGAVITDRIKHKKVWLGTFDTVEEASQAYLSKKSELKKLERQSDKEDKPKKNCDQVQQPESHVVASFPVANHDQTLNAARVDRRYKRFDPHETETRYFRVHKRKGSGKYTTEIRNPISKKRIWLGTFNTAEEASRVYQSNKLEFQKLVHAKRQCSNEQTFSKQDGKSEKLVNIKQGHENVDSELESAGGSEIVVQVSNSSNGGTEQRIHSHEIGTCEEAFYDYLSNKFDLQISNKVELQSNMPTDSSAREEKQEGQEDDEDLWMGEWVQLPGNRAVKFSLKLGLPIIDNYGSLLGEFSTLDDLSICKTEDGNET
ncbi:Ethylene-responsive transcription factor [Capsicum annuum]|nr:Ethylene-responsive transcription factor [Capsicum annuum]